MPKIKFKIKKFFKWIIAFLILVLTCSAITVPIECTNNFVHSQPTSVSSQAILKNNSSDFNFNEVIKKIPESTVLAKLESNFPENNKSSLVALNSVSITTAITIAIWSIPLFGWFEDAFAIADPVIDIWAAALVWRTYCIFKNASSHVAQMLFNAGTGFDSFTAGFIAVDLRNTVHAIDKFRDTVKATIDAGSTADPGIASIVINTVSMIVGSLSQFLPPTISQIQQEISQSNK